MHRKRFIQALTVGFIGLNMRSLAGPFTILKAAAPGFTLPALPYDYSALEPFIDKTTMEIHHDKHHQGYVNNLNAAVKGTPLETENIETILAQISKQSAAVRNNAGGHYNHSFFWKIMTPNGQKKPVGALAEAIDKTFGSFDKFKEAFDKAALTRFGSGWAWLVSANGKLTICSTPNQDNPLMDIAEVRGTPVIALDVWEHAYYLHYQNKRADYINSWWNIVNWQEAEDNYKASM
jgi:Fe-Mn family superoxide dismutase